jgi:Flp pilus assembly protein TadD
MNNAELTSRPNRRLDTWKEVGAFFGRDERTVKRWETTRGLPVHRVPGAGRSSVYAYTAELFEWLKTADTQTPLPDLPYDSAGSLAVMDSRTPAISPAPFKSSLRQHARGVLLVAGAVALGAVAFAFIQHHYLQSTSAARISLPAGLKPAANPEAQELYLQGLYHWNKRTPQEMNLALDAFMQSIVRDPSYAPAYAGLASCYDLLREYTVMPPSEAYPRAIAAAQRAISLDDSLAEAHNSLAFAEFYWSWDAKTAEREFQRALALDPKSVVAHHWYATFLMALGRSREALAEIESARDLDPHSSAILADKGLILFHAGQSNQAAELLHRVETSDPDFLSPHNYLALIALDEKNYKEYLAETATSARLLQDQDRLEAVAAAENGFAAAGGPGMLRAELAVQKKLYEKGSLPAYDVAVTYALLGDKKRALNLLQTSVDRHEASAISVRIDHNLQALHDDPAFRKLVERVGLPPLS